MPFKRLLLPLDGSVLAEDAISHAMPIARTCDAEIHLLRVLPSQSDSEAGNVDSVEWRMRWAEADAYLKRFASRLNEAGLQAYAHIREGRPAEQIAEFADQKGIDLVLISAYGKGGVSRFPFGSTVQKLICGCGGVSLMVIRPDTTAPAVKEAAYSRILVPMDGSHRSEWAACQVAAMQRGKNVELLLLQVIVVPEMPRRVPCTQEERVLRDKFVESNRRAAQVYLDEIARQLQNGIRVNSRLVVAQSVLKTIRQVAIEEQADLIAMSAHGGSYEELQGVTGSTCQTLVTDSPVPVLVLQDLPNTLPQRLQKGDEVRPSSTLLHTG